MLGMGSCPDGKFGNGGVREEGMGGREVGRRSSVWVCGRRE